MPIPALVPVLVSTGVGVAIAALVVMLLMAAFLIRNRQRCPKDGHSLEFVAPAHGHHMVFRCPKCGYHRKTKVSIGSR